MAREATPTEYKGITYRSKCEAMFALYLELDAEESSSIYQMRLRKIGSNCTFSQCGFAYEPDIPGTKWKPDFLTWRFTGVPTWFQSRVGWKIIEYKPSRPSDAYLIKFEKNINLLLQATKKLGLCADSLSFSLYFGNPYQHEQDGSGSFDFEPQDHSRIDNSDCDWLANYVDEIMSYRFDLKNGGTNQTKKQGYWDRLADGVRHG